MTVPMNRHGIAVQYDSVY